MLLSHQSRVTLCNPQVSEWRKHLHFCYGTGPSGDGQPAIDNLPNQDAVESRLLLAGHATEHAEPFKVRPDDSLHISRWSRLHAACPAGNCAINWLPDGYQTYRSAVQGLAGLQHTSVQLLIGHCHVITGGDAPMRPDSKGKTGHARFLLGGG